MKETEIQPFTIFQLHRITQLGDGLMNINNMEIAMQEANCDVLFTGDPDNERQIDKTVIKMLKGGICGIYTELKQEGLKDIADQIIFLNKS